VEGKRGRARFAPMSLGAAWNQTVTCIQRLNWTELTIDTGLLLSIGRGLRGGHGLTLSQNSMATDVPSDCG
jgi:membrane-associated PAP2 superfamily phosphatase